MIINTFFTFVSHRTPFSEAQFILLLVPKLLYNICYLPMIPNHLAISHFQFYLIRIVITIFASMEPHIMDFQRSPMVTLTFLALIFVFILRSAMLTHIQLYTLHFSLQILIKNLFNISFWKNLLLKFFA